MRIPDEEIIEPGDSVIELIDGEPYIYTQPDRPWKFAGLITLDDPFRLRFPEVSRRPGIYRVTIHREPRPARYVGQAKTMTWRPWTKVVLARLRQLPLLDVLRNHSSLPVFGAAVAHSHLYLCRL